MPTELPVERKLSEILADNIEPMSPLTIDFQGERFSVPKAEIQPQLPTGTSEVVAGERTKTLDCSSTRYLECAHGVRDSWVNIKLVDKGGVNGQGVSGEGDPGPGGYPGGSLDRVRVLLMKMNMYTCTYNVCI